MADFKISVEGNPVSLNLLRDTDNWLKGVLGDEIAIRYLMSRFLPQYYVFQFSGEKYQIVRPHRLWLHRFEGDLLSDREPDDYDEKALHYLYKMEGEFLRRVFLASTYDYLGIYETEIAKKCLIDIKASRYKQVKLSKKQRNIIPEALERGYEIFFIHVLFLENWEVKAKLLRIQLQKASR